VLHIEQREIRARRKAGGVVWFDFRTLCGGPRSQNDYLEIASQFHTVLLSGVPAMPVNMASEARRFTWLVDVFYDQQVKLVVSAEAPPEELVVASEQNSAPEQMVQKEFGRTASRLREMQSRDYFSRKHASAANPRACACGTSMTPTSAASSSGKTPRIPHAASPPCSVMIQIMRLRPCCFSTARKLRCARSEDIGAAIWRIRSASVSCSFTAAGRSRRRSRSASGSRRKWSRGGA